jgi:hypothetical protein
MQLEVRPARPRVAPALSAPIAASGRRRRVSKELPAASEAQPISVLTVGSSSVATLADKSLVALVLKTEEAGLIALPVTIEVCSVLRCQLAIAEILLNPKKAQSGRPR